MVAWPSHVRVREQPRLHILVVNDDRDELGLLGVAVEKSTRDIGLHTATDYQRAIDYLEGRGMYADREMHPLPEAVVLDLDMPLSGGFDFLDWRRASRSFSELPVLILSGSAYPGAIQTAIAMGASSMIAKPSQVADWAPIVEQIWDLCAEARRQALDKRL